MALVSFHFGGLEFWVKHIIALFPDSHQAEQLTGNSIRKEKKKTKQAPCPCLSCRGTVSVRNRLRSHFYLVKLKRIWIIDGQNVTSVARGNERPTPGSLLSLLWLTESANKDDTWQLTRPIMGGDMHTYTEGENGGGCGYDLWKHKY